MKNSAATARIARYSAENAKACGLSFLRTEAAALVAARHEFGATNTGYANGGFDGELAAKIIAEVFAA